METLLIETEVPEAVAATVTRLAASDKARLRRTLSAAVVEFTRDAANITVTPAPAPDSWDSFLQQSPALAVGGLPADFSVNHDHYLHGAPKRASAS